MISLLYNLISVSLSIALLEASFPVETSDGFLNLGLSNYDAVY
jgi:hypothetical protein